MHLLVQIGNARDAASTTRPTVAEHGHAARIVAAVFEATQSFDQDGDDITLRNRADNATHGLFLFSAGFQGARSARASRPSTFLLDRTYIARLACLSFIVQDQHVFFDVLPDRGARRDRHTALHAHRRHELRV